MFLLKECSQYCNSCNKDECLDCQFNKIPLPGNLFDCGCHPDFQNDVFDPPFETNYCTTCTDVVI